jgi:hypothetical protein
VWEILNTSCKCLSHQGHRTREHDTHTSSTISTYRGYWSYPRICHEDIWGIRAEFCIIDFSIRWWCVVIQCPQQHLQSPSYPLNWRLGEHHSQSECAWTAKNLLPPVRNRTTIPSQTLPENLDILHHHQLHNLQQKDFHIQCANVCLSSAMFSCK